MISRTVTFFDYDDKERTETHYFHIHKDDLLFGEGPELRVEMDRLEEKFSGPERDLTEEEVRDILGLVKRIAQIAYGVRSEDGEEFDKSPKHWERFTRRAAYDAVLWDLFSDVASAQAFMLGVMPRDLREKAREEAEKRLVPQDHLPKHSPAAKDEGFVEVPFEDPTPEPDIAEEDPAVEIARLKAELAAKSEV